MKFTSVVLVLIVGCGLAAASEKANLNRPTSTLTNNNELLLPANYRTWVAVAPSASGMPAYRHEHVVSKVYVEPTAYEKFVKRGTWPNHTVIVLELRDQTCSAKTPCDGVIGLEVAAKNDAKLPDPWSYYGIMYDRHRHAASVAEAKDVRDDSGNPPVDMRLAMAFPTLRAVIDAKPGMMQPSAF